MTAEQFSKALRNDHADLNVLADTANGMPGAIEASLDLVEKMESRQIVTSLGEFDHVGARLAATSHSLERRPNFCTPPKRAMGIFAYSRPRT